MAAEYARCHLNTPLACWPVSVYTPARSGSAASCMCYKTPFLWTLGRVRNASVGEDELLVRKKVSSDFFFYFSGHSGVPIHPLRCLELDICSSFSKVGLNLGRIIYLRILLASFIIRFLPVSFPSSPPPPLPFPLHTFIPLVFLTHSIYCVILFTSRPSPFHV